MSKIIFSSGTLAQGGAARVFANLSYPLCDTFDEVILVTWADVPQFYEYDHRAKWYCIPKEAGSGSNLRRMRWFRKFVKKEKPDLLLSFLEPYNLRVLISTIGLNVKTIVSDRSDPRGLNKYWIMGEIEKLVYSRAYKIIVQTETIRSFFGRRLMKRTHIIPNPINLPADMVGLALKTPKKKKIVCVGRLMPAKNLDILIKSFAVFYKKHSDYKLTIYGEGPLANNLRLLAESLDVGENVELPGPSKTIHQDILDAEMMCLVSNREGMSNAMIESMTLGLPCICTKVSGAIDLIHDKQNGFLVDIGDVKGLQEKMEYISEHPEEAYKIGENATKIYEELRKDKIFIEWMNYLKEQIQ